MLAPLTSSECSERSPVLPRLLRTMQPSLGKRCYASTQSKLSARCQIVAPQAIAERRTAACPSRRLESSQCEEADLRCRSCRVEWSRLQHLLRLRSGVRELRESRITQAISPWGWCEFTPGARMPSPTTPGKGCSSRWASNPRPSAWEETRSRRKTNRSRLSHRRGAAHSGNRRRHMAPPAAPYLGTRLLACHHDATMSHLETEPRVNFFCPRSRVRRVTLA